MPPKPATPRGARVVALATIAKQRRQMEQIAYQALDEYRQLVRRAVAHTAITAAAPTQPAGHGDSDLGPDVDLNALNQSALWPAILEKTVLPEIDKLIVALGPKQHMTASVVTSINAWRAQWLTARTQRLVGVPASITREIRDAIQASADEHGPNPQRAADIVKDMLNPDAPMWRNRAKMIARTEVVSSNNQGGLASWTAVHESLAATGGKVLKTWTTAGDDKVREDHAEVDGVEIAITDTFTVGDQQMNGPGDNTADADEVIQCRCTLTYRVDDGTEAGDSLTEAADAAAEDDAVDDSLTAAAGAPNTGVAVMLGLAPGSEQTCAAEGVMVDPPGLHCTVGYLAQPTDSYTAEQQQALISALATITPQGTADAFATAHFNPDDDEREPCAVLLVQSDWLAALHDQVAEAITAAGLEQATTFPIWIPHIAVAYNADPSIIPAGAVGSQIEFDRLVIGWGDQQIVLDGSDTTEDDHTDSPADLMAAGTPEVPVTAAITDAPPQSDGTPTEAAPQAPAGAVQWEGVLAELDVPSSDGRMILGAGLTVRDLPLPLSYQAEGSHGGDEAGTTIIVGRILTCTVDGGLVKATGDFFDAMYDVAPQAAIQQVAGGIGNVSVNLPVQIMSYVAPGPDGTLIPIDPMQYVGDYDSIIQVAEQSQIAGACIVDVPAFGQARIQLVQDAALPNFTPVTADAATPEGPVLTTDSITFPDGTVLNVGDQVNVIDAAGAGASTGLIESIDPESNTVTVAVEDDENPGKTNSITVDAGSLDPTESMSNDEPAASGAQSPADGLTAAMAFPGLAEEHIYPADWFEPVALDGPTGLTITPEGRVYGHLALHDTCHTSFAGQCVTPPESGTNYAYFHTGEAKTTDGLIAVGRVTVGGGHADLKLGWRGATEHYDDAGAAGAVVRAYRDEFGTQITGGLVPTITKDQLAALRRSPLSGDWRPMGAGRELVAALSVNSGGFPVPRTAIAADGRPGALVAAGVVHAAPGDGAPESGGLTLPSGVQLSADDIAVLASAFHDVTEQRHAADRAAVERAKEARALRLTLIRGQLAG